MKKLVWKPGTMLYPLPLIMVSCGTFEKPNVMTAAWTGIINSEPPMTYVSLRKERFSHGIIVDSGCFTINLVTENLCRAADFCGVKSGAEIDKIKAMGLKLQKSSKISSPCLADSPVNLECKVTRVIELGSHDMFMASIEAVNAAECLLDKKGRLKLEDSSLIAYSHGEYRLLGKKIGKFGYSVQKRFVRN